MNVFELLPHKNPRPQNVTDHPSEDQKTKPYEVLTSSKWPGLFQRDRFQHSVFETEWFLRCRDFADECDQLILCLFIHIYAVRTRPRRLGGLPRLMVRVCHVSATGGPVTTLAG